MKEKIENILQEYYHGYLIYRSEFEFKRSIHTEDMEILGFDVKLRHYSPQHLGDKPSIFYFIQQ
jgi:hypothetical protein